MWKLTKEKEVKKRDGRACPDCKLPLTDPTWLMCPRCRAVLSTCDGCSACGKCAKKGG